MDKLIRQPVAPRLRLRVCVLAVCTAIVVVACAGPVGTPRPSTSLMPLDFTPLPTTSPSPTPAGSPGPTVLSWPIGWDVAFCAMLGEAVIAQELVVDVARAIDEGADRDARQLARELNEAASYASTLSEALPEWDGGQDALIEIAALMDLDARAGTAYQSFLTDGSRAALRRARNLRGEIETGVPRANAQLGLLVEMGMSCPGGTLVLESP